ncbi:MAG: glycosyltransferase [Chloroflexi bacterium]|nr:glycosyltransferase [Chloroflexota bacterium]
MTSRRFLFLFSDTGGGHRSGAEAVAQALHRLYGDAARVVLLDFFVEMKKWPFSRMPDWYPHMLRARGIPWKVGFKLTDNRIMVALSHRLAKPYVKTAFRQLLEQHPADVIVSFHGAPNGILAATAPELDRSCRTVTVVLDFLTASAFWFAPGLDKYIVPYAEMIPRAQQLGLSPARIEALGMPVRESIREGANISKEEARRHLGLDLMRPLVLLTGGGEGVGPLAEIATRLVEHRPPAQIAVIAGRNRRLHEQLSRLAQRGSLQVQGFTKRMDLWLAATDILVTKAGPNSLAEAFVMGLPTVIYAAIPGQEEGNVTLVERHGAGAWAPGPKKTVGAVMALLADPKARARMSRQARGLATPDAALDIARRLWELSPV